MSRRPAKKKVLISACLGGRRCRYDGRDARDDVLLGLLADYDVIDVCPEEMAGFRGIRGPFEIKGKAEEVFSGKAVVVSISGEDVTKLFIKGAQRTLEVARREGVELAVLKSRSPSCGVREVYDGTFSSHLIPGSGVTAYLLSREGIEVIDSEEFKNMVRE